MKEEIYSITGKMVGHYHPEINGIIDTWASMLVSLDEFRAKIHDVGLKYAEKKGATTWIVDTSIGTGVFKTEIQDFIQSTVAPKCSEIGIRYFFVVLPQSALGKLSARKVAKINSTQKGMQTIEVASVEQAKKLLKEAGKTV